MVTILLTPEQQQAIAQNGPGPVKAVAPESKTEYVLVPAEVFERLKGLLDDDKRVAEEMAPLIWEVMHDDWSHPGMELYDSPADQTP